jgi:hypothetical protein
MTSEFKIHAIFAPARHSGSLALPFCGPIAQPG